MKTFIVAVTLFSAATLQVTEAKPEFVARIPNGANVPGAIAIGHSNNVGGGSRNQFGNDFDDAGNKWTTALCAKDSDGDGQSNGVELGDPCCTWTPGSNPLYTTASHPSDATKTVNASLFSNLNCTIPKSASTTVSLVSAVVAMTSVIASMLLL